MTAYTYGDYVYFNKNVDTPKENLMVAYLTNASLTKVTRREGCVRWGVYNLFFTPVHDWIHDCIQDWTREWDPALNTSAV